VGVDAAHDRHFWQSDGVNSHADPENPPATSTVKAGPRTTFMLPNASVTGPRDQIGAANK